MSRRLTTNVNHRSIAPKISSKGHTGSPAVNELTQYNFGKVKIRRCHGCEETW
jgi:hypothetical protein